MESTVTLLVYITSMQQRKNRTSERRNVREQF